MLTAGAPEPDVTNQRALSRLLLTDARVMATRGDAVGALQASLDTIRFGQDIGQDDTPVAGVGEACP